MEIEYQQERPATSEIQTKLESVGFENAAIQATGENGLIIRTRDLSESEHQIISTILTMDGISSFEEKRFVSIGPVIGQELKDKSWNAMILVIVMIIFYIAFAFRKVSKIHTSKREKGVSSFTFGFIAIAALIHDVIIPTGVFAYLGYAMGVQIDILFITALLAILGFSVNDTIVVFDRVRENLIKGKSHNFEETVGKSVSETIARSVNTSLTTLAVLLFLFFMGGDSTKWLSLALILGVVFGTYSSIFLASPLLVTVNKFRNRKNK